MSPRFLLRRVVVATLSFALSVNALASPRSDAALMIPRENHFAVPLGPYVYVMGGDSPDASRTVERYTPGSAPRRQADAPPISALSAYALALADGRLLVCTSALCDLY